MRFDRDQYWENRKQGKRGQGDIAKPTFTESLGQHLIQIGTRLLPTNRATARKKSVDHKYTTKGLRQTNPERSLAILERVNRTEAGEQQRIATKKAAALGNN